MSCKLSYWRTEPHRLDEYQSSSELPSTCDIAIIGAGFSGAATAYNLLQEYRAADKPLPNIVILEARQACSGATGRNGGHLKIQPSFLRDRVRETGWDHAEALNAFIQDQILMVKEVIEKEGIQCESELRRSYDVLLDDSEVARAKEDLAWLRQEELSKIELVDSVDSKFASRVCSPASTST
jgi:glycine/D-amino acid oxidase-like deaminating enzyme